MQLAIQAHPPAESVAGSLCALQALLVELQLGSDNAMTLNNVISQLSQLADSLMQVGLTGLQNVQVRLSERLVPLADGSHGSLAEPLEEWVQLNFNYLTEPRSLEHSQALVEFLNRDIWNEPLSDGQMGIINRLFELSLPNAESLSFGETPDAVSEPIISQSAAQVISASLDAILADEEIRDAPVLVDDASDRQPIAASVAEIGMSNDSFPCDAPTVVHIAPAMSELIGMIRDELAACTDTLHSSLMMAAADAINGSQPSFEDYRWQVERLTSATEALGLKGLHEFLARILETACLMGSAVPDELPQHCETLDRWPALVAQYLNHPGHVITTQALIEYATAVDFPLPLDAEAAEKLRAKLLTPELETPSAAQEARLTVALAEHVSLAVPEDINRELLESLLHELPLQTQEFSTALQRIAAGTGELGDLHAAQRIAHTLKGAANTVGVRGIAELAHHLEEIFIALSHHNALPPAALARLLVDAADCLEAMSDALLGAAPPPPQALAVLQAVLDCANKIDSEGLQIDEQASVVAATTVSGSENAASTAPAPSPAEPDATLQPQITHEAAPTLRVATSHIDDLLRLSGESKIIGGQLKEGLRRVESHLHAVKRQHQLLQQLVNELEQLVDIRGISMPLTQRRHYSEFDALEMDQYSELHTVSRRLMEAATDSHEWSNAAQTELDTLEDMLLSQTRHNNETQESVLKMRMVPASVIVGRLQRGVRQTCRLLDKEVELTVTGAETLIDSDSLNQLVDPLMHLMRNAIDHGIETAEQRIAHGKAVKGRLHIEFGREGNQIVVRCMDDGYGLDYAAIKATAEARGLIGATAALADAQLARLILEPGFSTRAEATQISGRGIGLDIVHSRVLELKGTLDVQSTALRGCRFTIHLPATLISAHALLVRHGKHTIAIASRGVRQILDAHAGKVSALGNRLSLQVGQQVYEAHRLESLLGHTNERRANERSDRPALLIDVGGDRLCAILVQGVVDTIDLVVKPLGPFVPRSVGLIGATILGDGSVAPVMDLPELLRADRRERTVGSVANSNAVKRNLPANAQPHLRSVLVVDDSLSVRRSMEQLLRDSGYEVRLARDGLEAVAVLEAKRPDIILVDLEMPRMNGMELTAHVRNRVETRDLPVIMITSRSTEKHRKQAESAGVNYYMTKPYTEDELLERMNTFLKRSA